MLCTCYKRERTTSNSDTTSTGLPVLIRRRSELRRELTVKLARVHQLLVCALRYQVTRIQKQHAKWRGGTWDQRRVIPFDSLAPLLEMESVSWHRLQYPIEADEHHANLRPLDCTTIERTAEWIASMDLVITIDGVVAHLAGALGVPVWTLLACHADWRWMHSRTDSPWYPTMRLFRQPRPEDWDSVVEEARRRLESREAPLHRRK